MNILQKIIYLFLDLNEKQLSKKLDKHLKSSSRNKTSKTFLSENITLTINSETIKNKDIVLNDVSKIVSETKDNPHVLLEFIKAHGTDVVTINNADKILSVINEETGLITEQKGLKALYINIITNSKLSFSCNPVIIFNNEKIDPYHIIHQFYRWYSLYKGLPGFDHKSQFLLKKYLNSNDTKSFKNLTLDEMTGLKEAIDRDNEAIDFTVAFAKNIEGSKKVLSKIENTGSADI